MVTGLVRLLRAFNTRAGRQAARNLLGIAVCTTLSQLALLGVIVIAANHLGPAGFGSFIFALTLQNYLCLIGSAGAQPVVVRDAAANPERLDQITTSFFAVTGSISLLVAACAIGGALIAPLSPDERDVILLFAVASIAASINLSPLFDVQHQQLKGTLGPTLADLLTIAVTALLAQTGALTLRGLGMVLACKWVLGTAIQALLFHFSVRRIRLQFEPRAALGLARSSLPILASYFLCIMPLSFGVLFLRFFRGAEATGVFGLACQAAALTFAFAWLGIRIIQPHIGGEYGLHPGFIRKLLVFLLLFLLGLGGAAFLGGALVIWYFFDPAFREAIIPMGVLIAASAILSAGVAASLYLLRFRRERRVLGIYLVSSVIYLAGCALLIPEYGIAGAANLTLVVAVIGTVIMVWLATRLDTNGRCCR